MSNITIYRFALDMTPGGVTPVVHLSQYDEAFQLEFTLYSRSGELDIPSGVTAMIEGTKLDGKAYSANANISGNVVTVAGDVQISAVAGNNPFQIVLKSGNSTVGSANFTISVERAAMDYDTVSDSKLAQIQDVTATAAQLTAAAENVTDGVETFEALAESISDMLEDIVDDTLSISGKAADAAKTGEELSNLKSDYTELSNDVYTVLNRTYVPTVGGRIYNGVSQGVVVDVTPQINGNYAYLVVPVVPGDTFVISGTGNSSYRPWCLTDSDCKCIVNSATSATDAIVKATDTGYLVCTFVISSEYSVKKNGDYIDFKAEAEARFDATEEEIAYVESVVGKKYTENDYTEGYYINTGYGTGTSGAGVSVDVTPIAYASYSELK